jgi:uncharacterized protein YycO
MKQGQVVITEGNRRSLISKLIAWKTQSWWTHTLIVTGKDEAVEAVLPRVRKIKLSERLLELHEEDRAYVVLDFPTLTLQQRWRVALTTGSFVGKFYDLGQLLIYAVLGKFRNDGQGTVVCSRLVSAVYKTALGIDIWDASKTPSDFGRLDDLRDNEVTPHDLLLRTKLQIIHFKPSSLIPSL